MNEIKNLTNKKLIDKYEESSSNSTKLLKEFFIRKVNNKISNEEFDTIERIITCHDSIIIDTIPLDQLNEKVIISSVKDLVDACKDKNR